VEIAEMFEDETIDIACPQCGHRNSLLVREVETKVESHIVCENCKVGIKIEARGFQERLDEVRKELEEIEREAHNENKKLKSRRVKDDYQI
jgi:transcription elongation factor Elf1